MLLLSEQAANFISFLSLCFYFVLSLYLHHIPEGAPSRVSNRGVCVHCVCVFDSDKLKEMETNGKVASKNSLRAAKAQPTQYPLSAINLEPPKVSYITLTPQLSAFCCYLKDSTN